MSCVAVAAALEAGELQLCLKALQCGAVGWLVCVDDDDDDDELVVLCHIVV